MSEPKLHCCHPQPTRDVFFMSQLFLAGLKLTILWLGVRRANHSAIATRHGKVLVGKFSGHTPKKPLKARKVPKVCMCLIGQSHFYHSSPCNLKTTWQRHHNSMYHVCGKKLIVNGCKTVQVAGNGVTMHGFPWGNLALLWQWILTLVRAGTPRKTVTRLTRICMARYQELRTVWLPNETDYSFSDFVGQNTAKYFLLVFQATLYHVHPAYRHIIRLNMLDGP